MPEATSAQAAFSSGLGQVGADAISQAVGYGFNAMGASKSWDRYKNSLTRGPGYMRGGLEAAGYNPILALTKGQMPRGVMPPAAKTGPTGGPVANLGSARKLLEAQTGAATSQSDLAFIQKAALQGTAQESLNLAEFMMTPEGKSWVRQKFINNALPQTWPGAIIRGVGNFGSSIYDDYMEKNK